MKKVIYVILVLLAAVVALAFVYYSDAPKEAVALQEASSQANPIQVANDVPLTADRDPNPYIQKVLEEYQQYIHSAIAQKQTPGIAIGIVRDSSIIYLKGFGVRQIGSTDSVDINTIFRLGSVSKSITASLAAKLVDDHFFSWDDPVTKFLPEFQLKVSDYTAQLTVRHVLSHTTGLPYHAFTSMIEEHTPLDTLIGHLKDLDLTSAPGKLYSYQNVGFSIIQRIVETSGNSFEEILREKLFLPLKMKNASASYQSIMAFDNVALPHQYTKWGWKEMPISSTYYNAAPAGGINGSISDMALWLKSLNASESKFWSDESRDEMFKPQIKAIARNRNFWMWQRPRSSHYGLGWRIITFPKETLLYHGGYVNGYRSEVAIHPDHKIAIAVLTNAAGNFADQSIPQFFKIYSRYSNSINEWENMYRNQVARK